MGKHNIVTVFLRYEGFAGGLKPARVGIHGLAFFLALMLVLAPAVHAQSRTSRSSRSSLDSSSSASRFDISTGSQRESSSRRSGSDSRSRRSSTDSRSRRSSSRDDTTRTAVKGTDGQPARAQIGEKTVVATRKERPGRAPSRGPAAAGLPEIKINPELHVDAVYFTPQLVHVAPGDRFATSVEYFNSATASLDSVDVWIRYDSTLLEPIWVDTAALDEHGGEDVKVQGWPEDGFVNVTGRLSAPMSATINPLIQIHWRALAPVLRTTIDFEGPLGKELALLDDGVNLIQTTGIGNRGRVSATVRIAEKSPYPEGLQLVDKVRQTLQPKAVDDATGLMHDEPIRLAILTPEALVSTDEVSVADIVVVNPSQLAFDDLRFRIRFDPDAVEILDADEDNYVNTGLNLFDGDFHEMFPFDYHGRNEIDPERGIAWYHAGAMQGPMRFPSGTVARIVYRMKRKAGKAVFWFERTDPGTGQITTDITNMGRSLISDSPLLAGDLLIGAEVGVRPLDLRGG